MHLSADYHLSRHVHDLGLRQSLALDRSGICRCCDRESRRALRLNEDALYIGESFLNTPLQRGDMVLHLDRRQPVGEIEADVQQDIIRAKMHGQQFIQPDDVRFLADDSLNLGDNDTARALAGEQPFAFVCQVNRGGSQHGADHKRGDTVHRRRVEELTEQDSDEGNNQAEQSCSVLEQDRDGSLLILPTDLPDASAEVLAQALAQPAEVVIAPDEKEAGTNLLLLRHAAVRHLPFAYGPGSYTAHQAAARAFARTNPWIGDAVLDLAWSGV